MTPYTVIALVVALSLAQYAFLAAAAGPRVIIVGAGMSGNHIYAIYQPHLP